MESRWGESSRGSFYGESRSYSYSEPRRVSTGESRSESLENSSKSKSSRIDELKEELTALKKEIIEEQERQETEKILAEIEEARQVLNTLRNGSQKRR